MEQELLTEEDIIKATEEGSLVFVRHDDGTYGSIIEQKEDNEPWIYVSVYPDKPWWLLRLLHLAKPKWYIELSTNTMGFMKVIEKVQLSDYAMDAISASADRLQERRKRRVIEEKNTTIRAIKRVLELK